MPSEIIFTSGSTEACAIALNSMAMAGCRMHFSPIEHHAASELSPVTCAASYHTLMIRNGYVRMVANNETGELLSVPVKEDCGDLTFRDSTTALGHTEVDVKTLGADYMAGAAHKFGGVPGAGFLWVKDGAPIYPLWKGGGQEGGYRGGTENLPAICSMAAAMKWQTEHMTENRRNERKMVEHLITLLGREAEDRHDKMFFQINTEFPCISPILNLSFPGVEGSALVAMLSSKGVAVSAGAACSTGNNEPSKVLMAKFNDEERARSAIRISFSHENTMEEVEEFVKILAECVDFLRSFSTTKM